MDRIGLSETYDIYIIMIFFKVTLIVTVLDYYFLNRCIFDLMNAEKYQS